MVFIWSAQQLQRNFLYQYHLIFIVVIFFLNSSPLECTNSPFCQQN